MNASNKVELTDLLRTRLKELQQNSPSGKSYTNKDIASILGITISQYKNIINRGHNKYVTKSYLAKLSELYNCSLDYIIGDSDDPQLSKDGIRRQHPISFAQKDEMLQKISSFLSSDVQTLSSLYLILVQFPADLRKDIVSGLNNFAHIARITTLLGRKDSMSPEKFRYICDILEIDSPIHTQLTCDIAKANELFNKKKYRDALNQSLKIIYYSLSFAPKQAEQAYNIIIKLDKKWKNFPASLRYLVSTILPNLRNKNFSASDKADKIIIDYFVTNNIEFKTRGDFLNSFY